MSRTKLVVTALCTGVGLCLVSTPLLAQSMQNDPTEKPISKPALSPAQLRFSESPDRAEPQYLANSTTGTVLYVYLDLAPEFQDHLERVEFFVDGKLSATEKVVPYDAMGATPKGANALRVEPGKHSVAAKMYFHNAEPAQIEAPFTAQGQSSKDPKNSNPVMPVTGKRGPEGQLKASGPLTITKDNAVVQGLDIKGRVIIKANNVTLKNSRVVSGNAWAGITVLPGFGGTTIDRVHVTSGTPRRDANAGLTGVGDNAGKFGTKHGDNVTVTNSVFDGYGDGIKVANFSLYHNNYVKMLRAPGEKTHVDGFQASGRTQFTITGNEIVQTTGGGHNAAIFIQSFTGKKENPVDGVVVRGNTMSGGSYTFHTEDGKKTHGHIKGILVERNTFKKPNRYGACHYASPNIRGNCGKYQDGSPAR